MTLPRSRADRRREGLLPAGEDPMLRRPSASPARPGPADPAVGRRRSDRRGPAPSPADVPTSATLSAPAAGRATPDAGRRSATTSAAPRAAAPAPGRGPAAGPVPARRSSDRAAASTPRAVAQPGTTHLPYTPGPPTPAPESEQPAVDGLDRSPRQSAPAAPRQSAPAAAGAGRRAVPSAMAPAPTAVARPVAGPAPRPGRAAPQPVTEVTEQAEAPVREGAPERVPGPASGPVGGRAAARIERQAAEAASRKSGRRGGAPAAAPGRPGGPGGPTGPGRDAAPAGRGTPRRAVQLALATVVTALVVLGVWSFTSPRTEVTSARSPAASAPASSAAAVSDPASSAAASPSRSAPPAGPVRAPITVLNSTKITGLAAAVGDQFSAGGWQVNQPGAYSAADVAVTTVFFAEGNPVQQEAANQLIAQFPNVTGGPAPRFFDIPGTPDPGLVVIVTGDWRP